jgi:hypothetical protein
MVVRANPPPEFFPSPPGRTTAAAAAQNTDLKEAAHRRPMPNERSAPTGVRKTDGPWNSEEGSGLINLQTVSPAAWDMIDQEAIRRPSKLASRCVWTSVVNPQSHSVAVRQQRSHELWTWQNHAIQPRTEGDDTCLHRLVRRFGSKRHQFIASGYLPIRNEYAHPQRRGPSLVNDCDRSIPIRQ